MALLAAETNLFSSVKDPGSGAFLAPGSASRTSFSRISDPAHRVVGAYSKIYILELLHYVQLSFVTLRHVTFTLCALRYVETSSKYFNSLSTE